MAAPSLNDLVDTEVDMVLFVRNYIELRMDHSVLRLLADPTGVVDGQSWKFTQQDGATLEVSLRHGERSGPEAAHFVPVRPDGTSNLGDMQIY